MDFEIKEHERVKLIHNTLTNRKRKTRIHSVHSIRA